MSTRRTILAVLVAALAVANLGWLALSRSGKQEQAAVTEELSAHSPNKPFRNPFPSASELRLFVETEYDDKGSIYSKPKGRALTASQRVEFESLIAVHTISPDEMFAACFIPHHFFRYFDKAGKVVGEVEVCFCCEGVQQSDGSKVRLAEGEMLVADFEKLQSFVASLGERTDVQCEGLNVRNGSKAAIKNCRSRLTTE
jgi:hypothetical protein